MPDDSDTTVTIEAMPGALYGSWLQLVAGLRVSAPPDNRAELTRRLSAQAILVVAIHAADREEFLRRVELPRAPFRVYDQAHYTPAGFGD